MSSTHTSIHQSLFPSIHTSIHPHTFTIPSIYPSIHPFYPSLLSSICRSIHLFVVVFVYYQYIRLHYTPQKDLKTISYIKINIWYQFVFSCQIIPTLNNLQYSLPLLPDGSPSVEDVPILKLKFPKGAREYSLSSGLQCGVAWNIPLMNIEYGVCIAAMLFSTYMKNVEINYIFDLKLIML